MLGLHRLNLQKFIQACNPTQTIDVSNPEDRKYYIKFEEVRGGPVIDQMVRIIEILPNPTCQLFTGHIGCGKSTELLRLKAKLEDQGFHVVYFIAEQELDVNDVDVTDILLAVAHQVSASLESAGIHLRPHRFIQLLQDVLQLFTTPIDDIDLEASFTIGLGKLTLKTKQNFEQRGQLRALLAPRTANLLETLNQEIINKGIEKLSIQNKRGLVLIIDNLDRITDRLKFENRFQPEYLFIDRGQQLKAINCHKIYSIPIKLRFSPEVTILQRLTHKIELLPMIPVELSDGGQDSMGIHLLKQMVMARAFPDKLPEERMELIAEVFDSPETLDRLCKMSGGHARNLLKFLFTCLMQQDPPLSRETLERVIRQNREDLRLAITDKQWDLLVKVSQDKEVNGLEEYQTLLKNGFIFEYRDRNGERWFNVNPILTEAKQYQRKLNHDHSM